MKSPSVNSHIVAHVVGVPLQPGASLKTSPTVRRRPRSVPNSDASGMSFQGFPTDSGILVEITIALCHDFVEVLITLVGDRQNRLVCLLLVLLVANRR